MASEIFFCTTLAAIAIAKAAIARACAIIIAIAIIAETIIALANITAGIILWQSQYFTQRQQEQFIKHRGFEFK